MGIAQKIELKQQQKLAITPRLQQAIHILQLSGPELEAYLEREVEKNPLLEFPMSRSHNDGFSALEMLGQAETRLESLHRQISLMRLPPHIAPLARAMAADLNDNGYLGSPIFEIADRHNAKTSDMEAALNALQACEPAGIGARSVSECLALQLKANNRFDPIIGIVVENLILVAQNDVRALAEKTGEPAASVREMISEIRALNPRPGAGLGPAPVCDVIPEIEVKPGDMGMWQVSLISEALPKVLIDQNYTSKVQHAGEAAADFTQQNLEAASWLIKALDQRANSILKVATAIVAHQFAWFEKGDIAMQPLTLSEVADEIGVHESTVSRVTAGKYLTCHRGTYQLKYFFTARIASIDKKTAFSALAIRARIKHHISQESYKNTVSDDGLVNILRSEGVDIARRTVAKYREAMGIPPSAVRRKNMRPQSG